MLIKLGSASHILLYHTTFSKIPPLLKEGIHNVTPDVLSSQLEWMKSRFEPVTVDRYFQLAPKERQNRFAVTFDDGYRSVLTEGFPRLKELGIPSTIFLNGIVLQGGLFWRDKIRYLINSRLVDQFLGFVTEQKLEIAGVTAQNFYKQSKAPTVSSLTVDRTIDLFLDSQGISLDGVRYGLRKDELIQNPLLTYGNHSFSHYVLSSLSESQQREEILTNHQLLAGLSVPLSKIFSIPFGAEQDFDSRTLKILQEVGYSGFLYSRNRLNHPTEPNPGVFPHAERYMLPGTLKKHQWFVTKKIFSRYLKSFKNIFRGG